MSSNYPSGLDSFTTHHDNNNEVILAADVNKIQDAIAALEVELGLTPKGSSADVAARLASLLTAATAASTYAKLVGPNTLTGAWDFTGATVTGGASLVDRGNWATTTSYVVGDVVTQSGQRYVCRTAHTSGTFATDLTATKWVSLDAVQAVATSRQVISGTGLAGGGDLTADRTLSVTYGTTSGTAAQGNDTRITGALQAASNLSDVANATTGRTNLGLGTAATISSTAGGDLTGTLPAPTVAKVNGVAVSGTPSSAGQVLAATGTTDAAWSNAAVQVDGGTPTSTFAPVPVGPSYMSTAEIAADPALTGTYAQRANNLSDLVSASSSRTNLGLGSAATQASTAFDPAGYAAGMAIVFGI